MSIATLGLALSAHAANVKLGTDAGGLVFDPDTVTIKAGESVTWTNNAGAERVNLLCRTCMHIPTCAAAYACMPAGAVVTVALLTCNRRCHGRLPPQRRLRRGCHPGALGLLLR